MKHRFGVAFTWLALACSCTPIEQRIATDVQEVASSVELRTGQPLPTWHRNPDHTEVVIQELLHRDLSETDAIKLALLNNHSVRAKYEQLGIARAELVQAGLLRNPIFTAHANLFDDGAELEFGIAQSFLDLFYQPMARRIAARQLEMAKAQISNDLTQLIYDIRRAIVQVRMTAEMQQLYQRTREATAASSSLMQKLHEAGNATDPQLSHTKAAFARARLDLASAELAHAESREQLNRLLGLHGPDTAVWNISGTLPRQPLSDMDLRDVESRAVQTSWSLAALRAAISAQAERIGLDSWQGLLSDGSLGITAMRESDGEWGVGPSAALVLPVFDHGQARVAGGQSSLRGLLHEQYQLGVELRSSARILTCRLQNLADRAAFFEQEYVPIRKRLTREVMQYYNAMQTGAFSVIAAKQQELDATREHIEALADACLARLDLEQLLAGSLPSSAPTRMASPRRSTGGTGHSQVGGH